MIPKIICFFELSYKTPVEIIIGLLELHKLNDAFLCCSQLNNRVKFLYERANYGNSEDQTECFGFGKVSLYIPFDLSKQFCHTLKWFILPMLAVQRFKWNIVHLQCKILLTSYILFAFFYS